MKKPNIALIGFMGTGKSIIGARLAEILKKKFIEMDDLIVQLAGKSIPNIFAEDGEIRFREYEIQMCKEVSKRKDVVIACGGGVVLNKINIDYLKQSSIVICLKTSPEVILQRISKDGKERRPLLNKPDPMAEIRKLLAFREAFYNAATEYQIDSSNLTVNEVVERIREIFKRESI
ncbi:MAG TPA: shikimate kinase [Candidatus Deferrimicrobium sp.]|nr:shikimate kinase [Candidatus Deferrimicrobium sp.]